MNGKERSKGKDVRKRRIHCEDFVQGLLDHGAELSADSYAKSLLPTDRQLPNDPSDIIETAAYLATPATMDLLIAHGARLEKGVPFHAIAAWGSLDEGPARLHAMFEHLQALGVDILVSNQRDCCWIKLRF